MSWYDLLFFLILILTPLVWLNILPEEASSVTIIPIPNLFQPFFSFSVHEFLQDNLMFFLILLFFVFLSFSEFSNMINFALLSLIFQLFWRTWSNFLIKASSLLLFYVYSVCITSFSKGLAVKLNNTWSFSSQINNFTCFLSVQLC